MYDHEHKFFIFQVKADFIPLATSSIDLPDDIKSDTRLYERAEYAILGCNCGAVRKTKVKNNDES